jgi:hypothetical protein
VLGRWRTEDSGAPVDAQGELPDGTKFDGPEELKAALIGRRDVFIRNLTSKLPGYARRRRESAEENQNWYGCLRRS